MKYKLLLRINLSLVAWLLLATACQKDVPKYREQIDRIAQLKALPAYLNETGVSLANPDGVLVLSEGARARETGYLSFLTSGGGQMSNALIKTVNGKHLGSITQDLAVYKQRLYILSQNGKSVQPGEMQHISIFDKHFRLLGELTPDVVSDLNVQEKPKHIALAHDNIYFYAGKTIYECEIDTDEGQPTSHSIDEINDPIDERIYAVERASGEYLYVVAQERVYRLSRGLELQHYTLPKGHRALAMALSPALLGSEDVYAWVLSYEAMSGAYHIIKLRNLQEEGRYKLQLNFGVRQASQLSLSVAQLQEGASLFLRDKGGIYRFDTQEQSLQKIYESGNGGRNMFYGYMGLSHRTASLYVSEFVDYALYHEAWLVELDFKGKVKKRYPVAPPTQMGSNAGGLYTPFCAGIYPIDALYCNAR